MNIQRRDEMVQLMVIINLLFIPVLPLYLLYRKEEKRVTASLELLFQYCIIATCNILPTKILIFLAKRVTGMFISIDSGYYTLAALVSSLLLFALFRLFQTAHIEVRIERISDSERK